MGKMTYEEKILHAKSQAHEFLTQLEKTWKLGAEVMGENSPVMDGPFDRAILAVADRVAQLSLSRDAFRLAIEEFQAKGRLPS